MKHFYQTAILSLVLILSCHVLSAQRSVSGLVYLSTGEKLEGVEVQVDLGGKSVTQSDGLFYIEAPDQSQWVRFTYMDESKTMDISEETDDVEIALRFDEQLVVDKKITMEFKDFDPHVDQSFNIAVIDKSSEKVRDRKTDIVIEQDQFELDLFGIELDSSYYIDFYADYNSNGEYDSPPEDHAWRTEIEDVKGDTSLIFTHSTEFTDIDWINLESEVDEDTTIYFIVDEMPSYPGGEDGLQDTITKYTYYPENAIEEGIEGTVYVGFVVEKDGSISNIEISRGISDILDSTAIAIVESLPNLNPGYQNGEAKRINYTIPITFTLPVVSTKLIREKINFDIYPNPTRDFINISLDNSKPFNYMILDLNGKIVNNGELNQKLTRIATHDLGNGSYIMLLRSGDLLLTESFIVY